MLLQFKDQKGIMFCPLTVIIAVLFIKPCLCTFIFSGTSPDISTAIMVHDGDHFTGPYYEQFYCIPER